MGRRRISLAQVVQDKDRIAANLPHDTTQFRGAMTIMARKKRAQLVVLLVVIIASIAAQSLSGRPAMVEQVYSRGIFPQIGQTLSLLTGSLPFSLAEVTVVGVVLYGLWWLWRQVRTVRRRGVRELPSILLNVALTLAVVYLLFLLSWGINYSRLPLAASLGLTVVPSSTKDLEALCADLIQRANTLRLQVTEDPSGVAKLPDTIRQSLGRAGKGYDELAERYPVFAGRYGTPKPVILSEPWSYTGIAGVYFPFTGEANVNVAEPQFDIPFTASHEMAHQRGFAREDEANYIAYLACSLHPDSDYRYSGTLAAMNYAMSALSQYDRAAYQRLQAQYSPGVNRDLIASSQYWTAHQGTVEQISTQINDSYLKSNKQTDGVASYGRMVDLLIAEFKQRTAAGE